MHEQAPLEQASTGKEYAPWELSSLIAREPITVSGNVSLADAASLMIQQGIGCLPVVDEHRRLVGSVTLPEVLEQFADQSGPALEEEFKFFKPSVETRPRIPAFFRRANGALVMPVACLEDAALIPPFALLGYDGGSGRILVKLGSEKEEGARKVVRDNDSFVIPASDFVAQFDIKFHGSAFDITNHKRNGCFVLLPKQPAPSTPVATATAPKR
ncbi:MAG TPA: CBS domain-containing protein [Pirellulales bacterium]|nr:CBS domain-containing protein [Pirellulales bacterium]